jgi:hypothetical protein
MTSTALFVLFLAVTALLLAVRGVLRRAWFYDWPLISVLGLLTVLAGYFAWRDHDSILRLQALVDLPPYSKSIYVPRGAEMRTMARLIPANVPPNFPLTGQESEQVKSEIVSAKDLGTFWILETSSRPESIHDFYKNESHRKGWEVAEQSRIDLVLKRQGSTLTIFFMDDFPRPDTAVVYILQASSKAGG